MQDPILYIEDEPDDVFFMKRALKTVAPDVHLRIITNGQEAANFFSSSKAETPDEPALALVLLDMNLPGCTGLEVLANIRKSERYKAVPVVILSASHQQTDIEAAYACGCNAYLVKPSGTDQLRPLVARITDFWIRENRYLKGGGGVAFVAVQ